MPSLNREFPILNNMLLEKPKPAVTKESHTVKEPDVTRESPVSNGMITTPIQVSESFGIAKFREEPCIIKTYRTFKLNIINDSAISPHAYEVIVPAPRPHISGVPVETKILIPPHAHELVIIIKN